VSTDFFPLPLVVSPAQNLPYVAREPSPRLPIAGGGPLRISGGGTADQGTSLEAQRSGNLKMEDLSPPGSVLAQQ